MTSAIVRQLVSSPRAAAYFCLAGILAAGWWLVLQIDGSQLLVALCGPSSGAWTWTDALLVLVMWVAMSLAMMIPTAFPMASAYADISEAAAEKAIAVPSPLFLIAGYVTIWLGFSATATLAQYGLREMGGGIWPPAALGLLLTGAGAYQFTSLKAACLTKCQRPMPYFLANWSDRAADVFRMGLVQGAACLGCCWAMMALGLYSGFMNPLWMGVAALLILAERVWPQPKSITLGLGAGMMGAGLVQILLTVEVQRAIW
jgi:predicted metal-binding membrane protein